MITAHAPEEETVSEIPAANEDYSIDDCKRLYIEILQAIRDRSVSTPRTMFGYSELKTIQRTDKKELCRTVYDIKSDIAPTRFRRIAINQFQVADLDRNVTLDDTTIGNRSGVTGVYGSVRIYNHNHSRTGDKYRNLTIKNTYPRDSMTFTLGDSLQNLTRLSYSDDASPDFIWHLLTKLIRRKFFPINTRVNNSLNAELYHVKTRCSDNKKNEVCRMVHNLSLILKDYVEEIINEIKRIVRSTESLDNVWNINCDDIFVNVINRADLPDPNVYIEEFNATQAICPWYVYGASARIASEDVTDWIRVIPIVPMFANQNHRISLTRIGKILHYMNLMKNYRNSHIDEMKCMYSLSAWTFEGFVEICVHDIDDDIRNKPITDYIGRKFDDFIVNCEEIPSLTTGGGMNKSPLMWIVIGFITMIVIVVIIVMVVRHVRGTEEGFMTRWR